MAKASKRPESKADRRKFTAEELAKWTEVVDVETLRPHPQNPNAGDQDRLSESISRHGQFEPKIISQDGYVLSGNHFYHDAMEKGRKKMAVVRLPIPFDHPQALEIMLAANHITRKGKDDKGILEAVLGQIREVQGDLAGAGFTEQEFDRLNAENEVANGEGLGASLEYKVIVDCDSEEQQVQLLERFEAEGLKVKALIA